MLSDTLEEFKWSIFFVRMVEQERNVLQTFEMPQKKIGVPLIGNVPELSRFAENIRLHVRTLDGLVLWERRLCTVQYLVHRVAERGNVLGLQLHKEDA